ncbi:chaperone protein DnaJ-like [Oppia nitens]|uniref:chaperone protein DnaJ-like n=1 Tax=Oppia nitens TaxID=1686743 RepID=UPI0023DAE8C1|nr:chaperone protein DnaJ-like [Oppia nitens]
MSIDYYQILGVSQTSGPNEISKAYKRLALRYHPDKNHSHGSLEQFKQILQAYQVLRDPTQRADYDLTRRGYGRISSSSKAKPSAAKQQRPTTTPTTTSALNNIYVTVWLTTDELSTGTVKSIAYKRTVYVPPVSYKHVDAVATVSVQPHTLSGTRLTLSGHGHQSTIGTVGGDLICVVKCLSEKPPPPPTQPSSSDSNNKRESTYRESSGSEKSAESQRTSTDNCNNNNNTNEDNYSRNNGQQFDGQQLFKYVYVTLEEVYTGTVKQVHYQRWLYQCQTLSSPPPPTTRTLELVDSEVTVTVKPGCLAGTRITYPGCGHQIGINSKYANLVCVIIQLPHPMFTRQQSANNNLGCTLPVKFADALSESGIQVPTLTGQPLTIVMTRQQLIEFYQNWSLVIQKPGLGLPDPNGQPNQLIGDLIVRFQMKS